MEIPAVAAEDDVAVVEADAAAAEANVAGAEAEGLALKADKAEAGVSAECVRQVESDTDEFAEPVVVTVTLKRHRSLSCACGGSCSPLRTTRRGILSDWLPSHSRYQTIPLHPFSLNAYDAEKDRVREMSVLSVR